MTMYRRGAMSPWAERQLSPEEQAIVRASAVTKLVGTSPRGPWVAAGPGGQVEDRDIRRAVNRAAGEIVLPEGEVRG